jgi:asparagine synthase (glutamine-hydrolysing)
MTQSLVHRGPDDAGFFRDDRAALGFRRLSIIDLEGSRQPLTNETGTVRAVFNGEIYNYQSLRRRLEAKGHVLKSAGDGETLVHLYEDEGENMFSYLRGMFALAIWDAPRRKLILARDRLGQKPLVYHRDPDRIVFASELKAILAARDPAIPRTIDPRSIDLYLTYGYIPSPDTIFRETRKLPPASYAVWHEGSLTVKRYWEPDWNREVRRTIEVEADELRATLDDSVREQMIADVPLGAFLSGGVDSTIVVGLMKKHSNHPIETFSIGFDEPAFDELDYARLAAYTFRTDHHQFIVKPRAWETTTELARQFDEPFADSSALPTWHVARETRRYVTVALTGDAGDELFGGYDRYRALALAGLIDRSPESIRRFLAGPLARALRVSVKAKTKLRSIRRWLEALADRPADRYLRWIALGDESTRMSLYTDEWIDRLVGENRGPGSIESNGAVDPKTYLYNAWNLADRRDDLSRAMIADIVTYLPGDLLVKVDLASMAHGLECRSPFLDHRIVEQAIAIESSRKLGIARGRSKLVLKRACGDLLPKAIRNRRKMGFGVPIDRWFRTELKDELKEILLDPAATAWGVFRREAIERMIDEHVNNRRDHAYRLWSLVMLELWRRNYAEIPG